VCARRSGPVQLEELRALWPGGKAWPALPAYSVLRLMPGEVHVEQKGRPLGAPVHQPDPEGEVKRLLEELRKQLQKHLDYFEALAFAHQSESPPRE
jgi:hypothetical protein